MSVIKTHTRNQKRMYRIHKLEEKVHSQDLLIGKLQQENKQLKEVIEEVRETLINSKEYKMANAMNLNAKQSVLVELLQILNKVKGE